MAHLPRMTARLPQLYRDGELVTAVLTPPALQLEIVDEDALAVQRAHWFDSALERDEAGRLGALLDITPEPWQSLPLYRAWLHALRDAMLRFGAVTRRALTGFVEDYSTRFERALGLRLLPREWRWQSARSAAFPALVENPPRRVVVRSPANGGTEPLHQFEVVNAGLDETRASFLLTGLAEGPEYVPVVANLTTGEALVFRDPVPQGQLLVLRAEADGSASAWLAGRDVTSRLSSVSGLVPGQAWTPSAVTVPARAITLARGANRLWFLPVAHFDAAGLDRVLLALADLLLCEGRYDETNFDHALFYQDPAVILRVSHLETQPARFEIELPAGAALHRAGDLDEALRARAQLEAALGEAVDRLRPAGVAGRIALRPFEALQGQLDRLVAVGPLVRREVGPTGADRVPDAGGMFEITRFSDSTFR